MLPKNPNMGETFENKWLKTLKRYTTVNSRKRNVKK